MVHHRGQLTLRCEHQGHSKYRFIDLANKNNKNIETMCVCTFPILQKIKHEEQPKNIHLAFRGLVCRLDLSAVS